MPSLSLPTIARTFSPCGFPIAFQANLKVRVLPLRVRVAVPVDWPSGWPGIGLTVIGSAAQPESARCDPR